MPEKRRRARGGEGDAVEADLDFGDVLDAVGGALRGFLGLHPARGVLDVGEALADAGAEQFEAGAGAGQFDDRRAEPRIGAGDALGGHLGERIDGRRADRAHRAGFGDGRNGERGSGTGGERDRLEGHDDDIPLGGHPCPPTTAP